jgi:hypothetical protein
MFENASEADYAYEGLNGKITQVGNIIWAMVHAIQHYYQK